MKDSDTDYMCWLNDVRVILDMSQSDFYNKGFQTLILADSCRCPPGFSLLKLFTPTNDLHLMLATVRRNDCLYVSSSKFIEVCLHTFNLSSGRNFTLHGPCASGVIGEMEFDHACCFFVTFGLNLPRHGKTDVTHGLILTLLTI